MSADESGSVFLNALRAVARAYLEGVAAYCCAFHGCPLDVLTELPFSQERTAPLAEERDMAAVAQDRAGTWW
ncbi:MAG TPA: hypothetical protein VE650_14230 [Acetobacteraceae bacterium]|nr:hypothetical protein [Acetobacteraceae bacterium]